MNRFRSSHSDSDEWLEQSSRCALFSLACRPPLQFCSSATDPSDLYSEKASRLHPREEIAVHCAQLLEVLLMRAHFRLRRLCLHRHLRGGILRSRRNRVMLAILDVLGRIFFPGEVPDFRGRPLHVGRNRPSPALPRPRCSDLGPSAGICRQTSNTLRRW